MATSILTSVRTRPARASFLSRIKDALALRQQRRSLGQLVPHLLQDIGITPTQARQEASRPVWDAPENWRK